jgi:hypothetical protein
MDFPRARRLWRLRIGKVRRTVRHLFISPPWYKRQPDYVAATRWLKHFQPSKEVQYDKALAYAWKKYDEICAASETLDRKANNLIQSVGILTGLLGFGITSLKLGSEVLMAPSLVCGILSIIVAALTGSPSGSATSASVADVLDDITGGHDGDAWTTASLHCAIKGRESFNNWKATRIRWATCLLTGGLIWLVLVLLVLTGSKALQASPEPDRSAFSGKVEMHVNWPKK